MKESEVASQETQETTHLRTPFLHIQQNIFIKQCWGMLTTTIVKCGYNVKYRNQISVIETNVKR
jgi:hypothetical protein